jgi:DUF4097 and DUF4098 domain-containing protein YvlB
MKPLLTGAASLALALGVASLPVAAQLRDNTERTLSCEHNFGGDAAHHCEMREQTVPTIGRLNVDASPNGAITVKGALRNDVLIRARIDSQGDTDAAAAATASQVMIDGSGGQVRANGPHSEHNAGWSVSYEIFVPQTSDLEVKSHNGAVAISDVRGQLHFEVNNGAVHLKRVAGDVKGATTNGAIQADLTGGMWEGRQLEIETHNGAVTITMPQYYSAHVQAETNNGGVVTDFPVNAPVSNETKPRKVDFNLGSGGPLIHVTTYNGQVRIKKAEAQ